MATKRYDDLAIKNLPWVDVRHPQFLNGGKYDIQAAMNYVSASNPGGYGVVYMPPLFTAGSPPTPLTYNSSNTYAVNTLDVPPNVILMGAGGATVIETTCTGGGCCLRIKEVDNTHYSYKSGIRNLRIKFNAASAGGYGIFVRGARFADVQDVVVELNRNDQVGLYVVANQYGPPLKQCYFRNIYVFGPSTYATSFTGQIGVKIVGTSKTYESSQCLFSSINVSQVTTGIYIGPSRNHTFFAPNVSFVRSSGIELRAGAESNCMISPSVNDVYETNMPGGLLGVSYFFESGAARNSLILLGSTMSDPVPAHGSDIYYDSNMTKNSNYIFTNGGFQHNSATDRSFAWITEESPRQGSQPFLREPSCCCNLWKAATIPAIDAQKSTLDNALRDCGSCTYDGSASDGVCPQAAANYQKKGDVLRAKSLIAQEIWGNGDIISYPTGRKDRQIEYSLPVKWISKKAFSGESFGKQYWMFRKGINPTSVNECCSILNLIKAQHNLIMSKLDVDAGVTDTDYHTLASTIISTADATDITSAISLATSIKSKHNAVLSKLDADTLVDDTNYNSSIPIAYPDASTITALVSFCNNLKTKHGSLVTALQNDSTSGDSVPYSSDWSAKCSISSANASDLDTSITLLNEILGDHNYTCRHITNDLAITAKGISNIAVSGQIATVTCGSAHGVVVGQSILISGVPVIYKDLNGSFFVSEVVDAYNFKYIFSKSKAGTTNAAGMKLRKDFSSLYSITIPTATDEYSAFALALEAKRQHNALCSALDALGTSGLNTTYVANANMSDADVGSVLGLASLCRDRHNDMLNKLDGDAGVKDCDYYLCGNVMLYDSGQAIYKSVVTSGTTRDNNQASFAVIELDALMAYLVSAEIYGFDTVSITPTQRGFYLKQGMVVTDGGSPWTPSFVGGSAPDSTTVTVNQTYESNAGLDGTFDIKSDVGKAISWSSCSGTAPDCTVTFTCSDINGHGKQVGDKALITGCNLTTYNGNRTVTAINGNQFSCSIASNPGNETSTSIKMDARRWLVMKVKGLAGTTMKWHGFFRITSQNH